MRRLSQACRICFNINLTDSSPFCRVLRRDIDAVCNAIDLPWSNGQSEGQLNRLKTIKRG
ncbi:hypothetical protein CEJ86_33185 [Sinorhizobium meliloti]|uniref:Transposase n=1 Tax=Rhizobium meliloti TaxID=382 RepID=A0A2J0YT44_RHIML|nr:hypothetical protein CEJ86_33185 [Sinorhizobium meliloti]